MTEFELQLQLIKRVLQTFQPRIPPDVAPHRDALDIIEAEIQRVKNATAAGGSEANCAKNARQIAGWIGTNPRDGTIEFSAEKPVESVIKAFNMRRVAYVQDDMDAQREAKQAPAQPLLSRADAIPVFNTLNGVSSTHPADEEARKWAMKLLKSKDGVSSCDQLRAILSALLRCTERNKVALVEQMAAISIMNRAIEGAKAQSANAPEPCSAGSNCKDRSQCWEPCGDLGKSEAHAKPAPKEIQDQINDAIQCGVRQVSDSETVPCNTHPDAPHGFLRNTSHAMGRYVCECEGWTPPDDRKDAVRLRWIINEASGKQLDVLVDLPVSDWIKFIDDEMKATAEKSFSFICPTCKADRTKVDCQGDRWNCGIRAVAQTTTDSQEK